MHHTQSLDFRGDPAPAFALATATLTASGFRLVAQTARSLEFAGAGMNSTRGNPLLGASQITLTADAGRIELQAELGGVRRMRRFLVVLLLGLSLLDVVVFGLQFHVFQGAPNWPKLLLVTAGPIAPWIVLGPLLVRLIRRRTIKALHPLLFNMVAVTRSC
jgi:hypothetical protein